MITIKPKQIWELCSGDIVYTLEKLPYDYDLQYFCGEYFETWNVFTLFRPYGTIMVKPIEIYPQGRKFTSHLLCSL